MYAQQYQVVGEAAHVTIDDPMYGRVRKFLPKHSLVPGNAPEVPHLLSVGLIAPVGVVEPPQPAEPVAEPSADSQNPPVGESQSPTGAAGVDAEAEKARAEARSKLPDDGSLPDGRAGHAVWVEAAVARGYAYEAAVKEDKKGLMDLLKQSTQ